MKFTNQSILNNTDYELNSEFYYVPASDKQMNEQKDMANKNIVGNLVYRNNFYNEVFSKPVYEKEKNEEKYQTPMIMNVSDTEFDYELVDLDNYFTKNTANKGYEKLVNAIENEEITYFDNDINTVHDFTQQDNSLTDWYSSSFTQLVENMQCYSETVEPTRTPFINDSHTIEENDMTYNIYYNPEKHHIYINDYPAIPIEENDSIRLLNDNLSENLSKSYENMDYRFSYQDFKTLEDDSYISIELSDYKDNEGKFIKNLIEDIRPNEIIKDRLKQNINTFDERTNFNALSVYRKDISNFENRNGLESLDEIQDIKEFYDNEIKIKGLNINNDIDKKALNNELAFNLYNEPIDDMYSDNMMLYKTFEYEFNNQKLPLTNSDRKEVLTYLNDAKNEFTNNYYRHTSYKSNILANNSLSVLDRAKYNLETDGISKDIYEERKIFFEGMKEVTLPLHNITKNEYKDREKDIEIINHFKNYLHSELSDVTSEEFKPNFIKDTLENGNHSIPFKNILEGSEEVHDSFIKNIKNEFIKENEQNKNLEI